MVFAAFYIPCSLITILTGKATATMFIHLIFFIAITQFAWEKSLEILGVRSHGSEEMANLPLFTESGGINIDSVRTYGQAMVPSDDLIESVKSSTLVDIVKVTWAD